MAADPGYALPDEPRPSALGHLVVRPFWPLLSVMLAGPWFAWPWFVVNAVALGSPHVGRQIALAVAGLAGTFALLFGIGVAVGVGLPTAVVPYLAIALTVWKLGVTYAMHSTQARIVSLHELYDGRVQNGGIVLVVAWFASSRAVEPALAGWGLARTLLLP